MSIKKTLLAAALAAFAMTAMPALASAQITGAHVKFGAGDKTTFTIKDDTPGGILVGTNNQNEPLDVECEEVTGHGEFYEGGTTGTITLTFHGCTAFNTLVKCTTPGAETSGTIETTHLEFHVEPVEGEPGILITSNEGHFATFKCSFLATIVVDGNGIVGTITNPGWTEKSKEATVSFTQTNGVQDHLTTDTDETEWDLKSTLNGGPEHTAALEDDAIIVFEEEVELLDTEG